MLFYVVHYDHVVRYIGTTWADKYVKNARLLSCSLLHGSRIGNVISLAQISLTGSQLSGLGAHLSGILSYLNKSLTGGSCLPANIS